MPRALRPIPSRELALPTSGLGEETLTLVTGPPGSYVPEHLASLVSRDRSWLACAWLRTECSTIEDLAREIAATCRHRWRTDDGDARPPTAPSEVLRQTVCSAPQDAALVVELDGPTAHALLPEVVDAVHDVLTERGLRVVVVVESEQPAPALEVAIPRARAQDLLDPHEVKGIEFIPPGSRARLIEFAGDRLAVVHDVARATRTWPVPLLADAIEGTERPDDLLDRVTEGLLAHGSRDQRAALEVALGTGYWHPELVTNPVRADALRPWLLPLDDRWTRVGNCWLGSLRRRLGGAEAAGESGPGPAERLPIGTSQSAPSSVVVPAPRRPVSDAAMEVRLFGEFDVRVDGRVIEEWRGQRGPSVLRYLLGRRRNSCSRDELLEEFWPDVDPGAARNRLQVAVSGLRRTFREVTDLNVVEFVEGRYRIADALTVDIDTDRFETAVAEGRRAEQGGDVRTTVRAYEEAAALYRGHFAQDAPFEHWTLLPRESFRLTYSDVLDRLSSLYLEAGRFEEAATVGRRMLEVDPCHEEAHRLLMRCYLRQGRALQAVRQFEFCVRVLRATLDTEPDQETIALFRSVRRGSEVS